MMIFVWINDKGKLTQFSRPFHLDKLWDVWGQIWAQVVIRNAEARAAVKMETHNRNIDIYTQNDISDTRGYLSSS